MKTVTLPIEEYEELVKDREDKNRLIAELEKNAEDRGFLVRYITHSVYPWTDCEVMREKYRVEIVSKDKVLADAQAEIERLSNLCEELEKKNNANQEYINKIENRGFFEWLFNKLDRLWHRE